jgi:uncharacterized membrane protein YheB (UPF0754 family)
MNDKIVTYTPDQTNEAVQDYLAGIPVEKIALNLDKSVRSVIAKLSREGVYQSKTKTAGTARITKAVMVAAIAAVVSNSAIALDSLEKASHDDLLCLYNHLVK